MPLKLVQIIGPIGYFLSMTEVPVEMSFLYRDDFLKIGDGVRSVTDEQIIQEIAARGGIDSTTRIELFGHGNEDDKLSHRIDLLVSKVDVYSDTPEEKAAKEEYNSVHSQTSHTIRILDIISNHAPLQIHIYSCHGGAAAKDVAILAEGSAIIGHVSNKHVTTLPNIHLIKMNANIAKHSGNYSIVQSLLTDFMLHLMPEAILGVKVALSSSTDDGVRIMRFDMPFDFIVTKEDGEKYLRELYGKYLDFVEEHKLFPGHMSKE